MAAFPMSVKPVTPKAIEINHIALRSPSPLAMQLNFIEHFCFAPALYMYPTIFTSLIPILFFSFSFFSRLFQPFSSRFLKKNVVSVRAIYTKNHHEYTKEPAFPSKNVEIDLIQWNSIQIFPESCGDSRCRRSSSLDLLFSF